MSERYNSFLDPLNQCEDWLRDSKEDLAAFARALHMVGNTKLADDLADIAHNLSQAMTRLEEGRSMALNHIVRGSEVATTNMINAAIAASSPVPNGRSEGAK